MREGWTNDMRDDLRRLASQGLSAREIGVRLGRNKNSIIGQAHRLGVQLLGRPGRSGDPTPAETYTLATEIEDDLERFPDGASIADLREWFGDSELAIASAVRSLFLLGKVTVRASA